MNNALFIWQQMDPKRRADFMRACLDGIDKSEFNPELKAAGKALIAALLMNCAIGAYQQGEAKKLVPGPEVARG